MQKFAALSSPKFLLASIAVAAIAVAALPLAPMLAAGNGAPPDGLYQCNKISGSSYINIGTLEIKGKTYRGFVAEGPFHPYAMDASGAITWTSGLAGMPDGWKLQPAAYKGLDSAGKPLIEIRYTSARGAADVVDAVRE